METKTMPKNTTQEERLDYLVEEFKANSAEYKELQILSEKASSALCR